MPASKHQLGRYRIIDQCLGNRYHMPAGSDNPEHAGCWTLNELIDAICQELDLRDGVSPRTVKEDIARLRHDPDLGFYAPIETVRGVGYRYSDPDYRMTDIPLTPLEVRALEEVVEVMKQFKGMRFFEGAEGIIHRIEENLNKSELLNIEFDILDRYSGLENLEPVKKAIREKKVIKIYYKAFYEEVEVPRHVHPYLLKEYNNRWFLYGFTEEYDSEGVYGLERMNRLIEETDRKFRPPSTKRIKAYFNDIIGVTNLEDREVEDILLRVKRLRAQYLITKPVHHSQELAGKEDNEHIWIKLRVKPNPELMALLLSFGDDLVVEKPASLAREVREVLLKAANPYKPAG